MTGTRIDAEFGPRRDFTIEFFAMGSPCAVIVSGEDAALAAHIGRLVSSEAYRVESKFARDKPSVLTAINEAAGSRVELDAETAELIDYAHRCFLMSEGLFDMTAGPLSRAWRPDGTHRMPEADEISRALQHVGWARVRWERPFLTLESGMEIDLAEVSKEYAVDRAMAQALQQGAAGMLINFGGAMRVSGARADGGAWQVAVENVDTGERAEMLELSHGSLATSGNARRFLRDEGKRFGRVLNPRTGWPIPNAPRSVTVLADSCSEAGLLAKLALLRGLGAEAFLRDQKVRFWIAR